MQAIVVEKFGTPEVLTLKDIEKPTRKAGQILVKIHSATVNPLDTVLRKGIPMGAYTPALPYVPGFGIAGVVIEVDANSRFKNGDRVWGSKHSAGGYSEYALYTEDQLEILPEVLSFSQGATIDTAFRTSFWSLFDLGQAKEGETVVVTGAAGSVGSACIQVAKSAGLKVVALCSGGDIDTVISSGADKAFDYRQENLQQSIEQFLDGAYAKVFVDVAAVQNAPLASKILKPGGTHVVVGPGGNTPIAIDPYMLIEKGLQVCGVALYNSSRERHAEISKAIADGFERGLFKVAEPVGMPLSEAKEAHMLLESGKNSGKLVLTIG